MKVEFENIKSGERVNFDGIAEANLRAAQIDAYVNSSNLGVNSNRGQDYAWRLAPEVAAHFDVIKSDFNQLNTISKATGVNVDDLSDGIILGYMVSQQLSEEAAKNAKVDKISNHEDAYRQRVADAKKKQSEPEPTVKK